MFWFSDVGLSSAIAGCPIHDAASSRHELAHLREARTLSPKARLQPCCPADYKKGASAPEIQTLSSPKSRNQHKRKHIEMPIYTAKPGNL
jgi:hypothetical protein